MSSSLVLLEVQEEFEAEPWMLVSIAFSEETGTAVTSQLSGLFSLKALTSENFSSSPPTKDQKFRSSKDENPQINSTSKRAAKRATS